MQKNGIGFDPTPTFIIEPKTNGVMIVNTKTTITDFTDSDLTCEEIAELMLSRAQEEGQQNG